MKRTDSRSTERRVGPSGSIFFPFLRDSSGSMELIGSPGPGPDPRASGRTPSAGTAPGGQGEEAAVPSRAGRKVPGTSSQ